MEQFVRDLITSVVSAGLITLMACGIVLTYATTRIFNLGYAGVAFAAAYVYFELNTGAGWPSWAAAAFVLLVMCPLLGLILDAGIFRRLAHASETAQIVATLGVLLALPALCIYVVDIGRGGFGWNIPQGDTVDQVPGPGPQPPTSFHLFSGVAISSDQVIVLGVTLVCIVGLVVFLTHSHAGLRMRALADRRDLAGTRGVNEGSMSRLSWVIGSVLAGVAGVAGAPLLHSLNSGVYTLEFLIAVCAAVLGRFSSILLAVLGAFIISLIADLMISYWHWASNVPGFTDSIPFLFLVIGFAVLGAGRVRIAGSISAEAPPPDYRADLPAWRRRLPPAIGLVALVVFVFFIIGSFWVQAATQGLIYSLVFLSITIITGIGGMVSLAQAAFVSTGALFAGMLIQRYGLPWLPALICAVIATVVLGVLFALSSLRLSGLALALSTLALAFACSDILFQLSWLGNGLTGWTLTQPKVGPFDLANTKTMAAFALILVLATVLLTYNLQRSTTGRQMLAVRNSPAAAASIGVSPTITKLKLFALSAAIAAVGGVLLATTQVNISTGVTGSLPSPLVGLLWLAIVVVFGVRRPAAAIVGGLVYSIFPALLSSGFTLPFGLGSWAGTQAAEIPTILFGLGAVFLARQPNGFLQGISRSNFERRERKRLQNALASEPSPTVVIGAGLLGVSAGADDALVVQDAVSAPVGGPTGPVEADGTDAAIHIDRMCTGYGQVTIIRDLTLSLAPGTITVLLGANGAGKSTTCQAIAGLLPATSGRIFLKGIDVTLRPSWWRSLHGVYLAPEGRGIFPSLSVDDNLKLTLKEASDRSVVYGRFSNLAARRDIPAGNLSGGEQQMLALAPALVQRPEIVISDEPTLGLASRVAEEILEFFDELRREGSTVLIAGESPREILEIADAVTVLHGGRVVWSGNKSDLTTDVIEEAYFGDSEALSVT